MMKADNLMQKAIFFDRDGVLNKEIGDYVCQIDDFEILPDAVDCIKLAKSLGFLAIVITNQGGIGKKLYSPEELNSFHQKLPSFLYMYLFDLLFSLFRHHPHILSLIRHTYVRLL